MQGRRLDSRRSSEHRNPWVLNLKEIQKWDRCQQVGDFDEQRMYDRKALLIGRHMGLDCRDIPRPAMVRWNHSRPEMGIDSRKLTGILWKIYRTIRYLLSSYCCVEGDRSGRCAYIYIYACNILRKWTIFECEKCIYVQRIYSAILLSDITCSWGNVSKVTCTKFYDSRLWKETGLSVTLLCFLVKA